MRFCFEGGKYALLLSFSGTKSSYRLSTLTDLPSNMMGAKNLDRFCSIAMSVLSKNDRDVMSAMLYTIERHKSSQSSNHSEPNQTSSNRLILRGSIRIPDNHPIAINQIETTQRQQGLMKWFSESQMTGERVILRAEDESFPPHLLDGIPSPSEEPCRSLVIYPLRQGIAEPIFGWLVFLANPRTDVDEKYLEFVQGVSGLLSTSMASLMILEEAAIVKVQSQEKEVFHKASLSHRLQETELQVKQQERIFHHFVEHSSMGIFIFSPEGEFLYRNRRFNEIYQCDNDPNFTVETAMAFYIDPEFVPQVKEKLGSIIQQKEAVTLEIRLTKTWNPINTEEGNSSSVTDDIAHRVWVIASAFPEIGSDGEVVQVLGCITDISALKYSNYIQERRTEDAEESKRRLENFIDSTNHELRNPLSAVILAGEDVMTSVLSILDRYPTSADVPDDIRSLLNNLIENGKTIIQCAKHQKRIVDDILTASKIDSNLVEVCPSEVEPEEEIRACIKMFEADAQEADVKVSFECTPEYRVLVSTTLIFDPTRFVQVFINLLTNAIKFTRFERIRKINVILGASVVVPTQTTHPDSLQYIERRDSVVDPMEGDDWGTGPAVFLSVTVNDTGRGLTDTEKAVLFARFTQASPRTHVKYGGSGLGLFISRRLSELQGGAIGFTSKPGVGSVFSFYIKVRKAIIRGPHLSRPQSSLSNERRSYISSPSTPHILSRTASHDSALPTQLLQRGAITSRRKPESLTILVVEDNLINQKMLARQLQKLGCSILVANHGLEAIDQISDTKYGRNKEQDLSMVLLDWEMPIMDGISCIRRVREMEKNGIFKGHVPVIGVTANARSAQLQHAVEAGMVSIMSRCSLEFAG
jgi:signal transduction histidine kinase/CheY-like chemotaxis protein